MPYDLEDSFISYKTCVNILPFYLSYRHVAKTKPYGRRVVFYRAPCGRRLRNLDEVDSFLEITKSGLSIDNFCCDAELHVHHEFIPVKVRTLYSYLYYYPFVKVRTSYTYL
jgi:hypothetical protein